MRKSTCFLVLLCCVASFSCSRYCCDVPQPVNTIDASRNGLTWQLTNTTGRISLDTLTLADTSVNPQQSELLVFKLKFNGADSYTLTPANVVYAYVPQMDNPYVYYTLDSSFANSFTITSYDAGNGFVTGIFSIKVNKDPANTDTRYPQSVSFLNGSFRVQLSK